MSSIVKWNNSIYYNFILFHHKINNVSFMTSGNHSVDPTVFCQRRTEKPLHGSWMTINQIVWSIRNAKMLYFPKTQSQSNENRKHVDRQHNNTETTTTIIRLTPKMKSNSNTHTHTHSNNIYAYTLCFIIIRIQNENVYAYDVYIVFRL